jgi:hypothetical protein
MIFGHVRAGTTNGTLDRSQGTDDHSDCRTDEGISVSHFQTGASLRRMLAASLDNGRSGGAFMETRIFIYNQ